MSIENQQLPQSEPQLSCHLLIRPAAYVGEHPFGYKLRLAYVNGLADPRWMDTLSGPAQLKGHGHARWCPHCLATAEPFWRSAWQKERAACMSHGCWLVDICPSCYRRAVWSGMRFLSCKCGQHLIQTISPEFSPHLLSVLHRQVGADERWNQLSIDERWRTCRLLGALQVHGLNGKPMKKASGTSVATERQLLDEGAAIIANGREALFALLDRIRVQSLSGDTVQIMGQAFPMLLRLIRKQLSPQGRRWLEDEIDAYVLSTADRETAVVWRGRGSDISSSIQGNARMLRVRPTRLPSVCAMVGVEPKSRRTRSGRRRLIVCAGDVARIKRGLDCMISMRGVAHRFGLSAQRQKLLAEAGLIRRSGAYMDGESISRLLRRLVEGQCRDKDSAGLDGISLAEAFRNLVPVSRTVQFIEAALHGKLGVFSGKEKVSRLDDLLVSKHEVVEVLCASSVDALRLTICEAAERLEVKQEVMYHLLNVGLLNTSVTHAGRRATRVIDLAELERFRAEVEPLTSAAARAGVDFRSGLAWAKRQGLSLVSGPCVDGGRQYFVLRCG